MILEVDIGNTRTKWRIKGREKVLCRGVQATESIISDFKIDRKFEDGLTTAAISSVINTQIRDRFIRKLRTHYKIQSKIAVVSERVGLVECGYKRVSELGVDRWLAILASFQRRAGPTVVIDAGSALTIDFVDDSGKHKGGYIAPGISMMRDSLLKSTEGISACATAIGDPRVPGSDTGEAVSKGCFLSATSLIKYLIKDQASSLVLTGGDAELLLQYFTGAPVYVEDLVLEGLSVTGVQFETLSI